MKVVGDRPNTILDRLNSIWKNLFVDFLCGVYLAGLIIHNIFFENKDLSYSNAIGLGVMIVLLLHGFFLLFLIIKNVFIHINCKILCNIAINKAF